MNLEIWPVLFLNINSDDRNVLDSQQMHQCSVVQGKMLLQTLKKYMAILS